jgi:hypothetical protein
MSNGNRPIVFGSSSGLFRPCSSRAHANAGKARSPATRSLAGLTSISNARLTSPRWTDLLVVEGRRILPIEVKTGAAVNHHAVAGLRQCMKDLGLRRGWVISTARERRRLSPGIEIIPWTEIASGRLDLF